eukprot:TRINITY_DN66964_c0_g1_i1.p1 TRINITY_DN66964_c0_g1~~TRINITY_DN66964_c0_g1_i1.p1  ORF type:complete len:200 (-),score=20.24 TRINITY_DN66964_c0_g1_i1:471-1070(-)
MNLFSCCCNPKVLVTEKEEIHVTFTEGSTAHVREQEAQPQVALSKRSNKRKGTAFPTSKMPVEDEEDEDEEDDRASTKKGDDGNDHNKSQTAARFKSTRGRKGTGVPSKEVMKKIEAEIEELEKLAEQDKTGEVHVKTHNDQHYEHGILHSNEVDSVSGHRRQHIEDIASHASVSFDKHAAIIGTAKKASIHFAESKKT